MPPTIIRSVALLTAMPFVCDALRKMGAPSTYMVVAFCAGSLA